MRLKIRPPNPLGSALWMAPGLSPAIPSAPATITPRPSDTGNHVPLTWSAVKWSHTPANDWSAAGTSQAVDPGTDNGSTQLWKAAVSAGIDRRFIHLRVIAP